MRTLLIFMTMLGTLMFASLAPAQENVDYRLGAGDMIHITVFQNPDLTLETRVSESGAITFPLIGSVQVGGLSSSAAERLIAQRLSDGNFVKKPQVNIAVLEVRGSQVSVLGMINKPGRFPLDSPNVRLSEIIAIAGGVMPAAGSGTAVVTGLRNGKPFRTEMDIASLAKDGALNADIPLKAGDVVYVMPGNQISILGQVNHPGRFPLENGQMHLSEAVALAGGLAPGASDVAIVTGLRQGKPFRKEVDVAGLFLADQHEDDIFVAAGDEIYVHRAPVFYIYGEAQKPGAYRVERNMTVIQALAQGGGPTSRGTERNLKLLRRNANGKSEELQPKMTDPIRPDDVLYVRESLF